ncbi:HEPN domain-containing protein [Desulfotomaculum defluvii]
MNEEILQLINYRLSRAEESIEEAALLFNSGHFNTSVNRLYYACFYAVSALLPTEGMSSPKHSGIRSLFNQYWVKPGRISIELGKFYRTIFDYRQKGDYTDFVCFDIEQVDLLIEETKAFVQIIKGRLSI